MFTSRLLTSARGPLPRIALRHRPSPIISRLASHGRLTTLTGPKNRPTPSTSLPRITTLTTTPILSQLRVYATETNLGKFKKPRGRFIKACLKTLTFFGFIGAVFGGALVCFFIYDATTYSEEGDATDIAVSELALSPERGGPKNLPIARVLVDDDESEGRANCKHKPKLVVRLTFLSCSLLPFADKNLS